MHSDCLFALKDIGEDSIDAIITDPPYGLSFMGKKWDYEVPSVQIWAECLRVLKPGGHLLSFAGTRTQHRMAVNIEDAGFEIRDMIAWVYGSGFPKSHNLKDKRKGWGTALKPAMEPITVARKPLEGTVAENVMKHRTGSINVDGCRVGFQSEDDKAGWKYGAAGKENTSDLSRKNTSKKIIQNDASGRWPANLIHDGSKEVVGLFPFTKSGKPMKKMHTDCGRNVASGVGVGGGGTYFHDGYGDSGSAARFFYCAKASKADREEGCEELRERKMGMSNGAQLHGEGYAAGQDIGLNRVISRRNHHPTVKPTELMRYLCRLVTPPNGTILDPFMGSGSTGKAAVLEGFNFIGIEREVEYMKIAEARIGHVEKQKAEILL